MWPLKGTEESWRSGDFTHGEKEGIARRVVGEFSAEEIIRSGGRDEEGILKKVGGGKGVFIEGIVRGGS